MSLEATTKRPLSKMKRAELHRLADELGIKNPHLYALPYLRDAIKTHPKRGESPG